MADRNACSSGPSLPSRVDTQAESLSLSQVMLLTSSTSSDNTSCPCSSTTPGDAKSIPGENASGKDGYHAPDIIPVESTSQNPSDVMNASKNGRTDQASLEGSDQPYSPYSACDKRATSGEKEIKVLAPEAHESRTSVARLNRTKPPIILCILAMCLLATVIIYVQSTYAAEESSRRGCPLSHLLKNDVSRTLTILRTSQGILSALVSLALENVFVLLQ